MVTVDRSRIEIRIMIVIVVTVVMYPYLLRAYPLQLVFLNTVLRRTVLLLQKRRLPLCGLQLLLLLIQMLTVLLAALLLLRN